MNRRRLFMMALTATVLVITMIAAVQVSFAGEQDVTAVYEPKGSVDPVTLSDFGPVDPAFPDIVYEWRPLLSEGDVLKITENGVTTEYVLDNAQYKGNLTVRGFFDDDGHALAEKYKCIENGSSGEISSLDMYFEWVGGPPTESGKNAAYRFILDSVDDPDAPTVKTQPIEVYVMPCADIDGIVYAEEKEGIARVDQYSDYLKKDFVIRDTVTLDNGKEYRVEHIGASNVRGSVFADSGSFFSCDEMRSVVIPDSITSIKSYAFFNVPKLKEVTIPPSVTKIGDYSFGFLGKYDFFGGGAVIDDKVKDFVIYAKAGSEGYRYAKDNGLKCIDPEEKASEEAADAAYYEAKYTPVQAEIVNVKAGKGKLNVKWKKVPKATIYKIRYSRDETFSKGVKTKSVKGYTKKGLTIKKLKRKQYWYVQVSACRTVSGKTYQGEWSEAQSVKVK